MTDPESQQEEDGEEEWPGILICAPCKQYVGADKEAEETACEHTWDEAQDISDLDGETWALIRHDAYVRELDREDPRSERSMILTELMSLMYDLTMADVLPDDYDEKEGLERLQVAEP